MTRSLHKLTAAKVAALIKAGTQGRHGGSVLRSVLVRARLHRVLPRMVRATETTTEDFANEDDSFDRCHADAVDFSRVGLVPRLHHELYRRRSRGNDGSNAAAAAKAGSTDYNMHDGQRLWR